MEILTYGKYYHILNRGVNRQNIFVEKDDYEHFFRLMPIIATIIFLFIFSAIHAQYTSSERAKKLYNSAYSRFNEGKLDEAEQNLIKAIKEDSTFTSPYYILADLYNYQQRTNECIALLEKNVRINYQRDADAMYYLGMEYLLAGRYSQAKDAFDKLLANSLISGSYRDKIKTIQTRCEFAVKALQNPVPFSPVNLGPEINSSASEYLASVSVDEQTLLFTRMDSLVKENEFGFKIQEDFQEDFYISIKTGGRWTKAVNLGPPVNTQANEGAQSFSADGQLIFFTACMRPGGYGDCDLYFSRRIGDRWSEPKNLGRDVNTQFRESEPSFSSDGKTLYFVSDRPGGYGQYDIWKTTYNDLNFWTKPVNLGPKINTDGHEMSPFIHFDNQTLYFSSNSLMGMGGRDIFYSRKDSADEWQEPINIGYPINTNEDEADLTVSSSGTKAYFSSSMPGGYGNKDLYEFDLYPEARPIVVTYLKGIVSDAFTKENLEARFELIDLETGNIIIQSNSNPKTGEFLVSLPVSKNYALNVSKEGYLFHSENFSLTMSENPSKPYQKNIELQPIKVGEKVILNNIFFETDSYGLKPESKSELDKLVLFLKKNKAVKIRINGHTDNTGSAESNMMLSNNRAKSVTDYLANHGIENSRLVYKGFGESQPVATNDTEHGRAQNRRTEFEIIETSQ
ncbi:MAG: PD40 domain-containing protein [Bacteroidia bacterium]|nr:PD40 domain-containing protein [Bacteroidia bacterium]